MAGTIDPEAVIGELNRLWASLGEANAEEGVLRACTLTLVLVERAGEQGEPAAQVIAETMREHPSRAILVRLHENRPDLLEARVVAQCWKPFGSREQICCEQIEIDAGAARLPELQPVLLALAAPDLPVAVWARSPGIVHLPGFSEIASTADRLILDCDREPESCEIPACKTVRISDLAWTRTTHWREIVAQLHENPCCRDRISQVRRVIVRHTGDHVSAHVRYFGAWLAQASGWAPGADSLVFEPVPGEGAGLAGLELTGPGLDLSIKRLGETCIETNVNSIRSRTTAPAEQEADLLKQELSIAGRDRVFERVLEFVSRMPRGSMR